MTTAYPGGTDAFVRPSLSQMQDAPELDLTVDNIMDAVEALQKHPHRGYDVKGFGAAGDNAANDTAEINDASAATREVFFPPGTYLVDAAALTLDSNIFWRGAGRGLSIIKLKDSGNGKLINHESGAISNVTFMDLGFDGNMVNQTNGAARDDRAGLFLRQITGLQVVRCGFTGFRSGAAIRAYGCSDILYFGNRFITNGIRAVTANAETVSTTASTIEVDTTAGWPSTGKLRLGGQNVTYTGITATSFTGCTITSGSFNFDAGSWVFPMSATDEVLICDATFTGSSTDYRVLGNRFISNTDTGTAMDGVNGGTVTGNTYRANLLGCGVAWSNAETGGAADSCEDITIVGNTIVGPLLSSIETQGVKVAQYNAGGGDGGNNRNVVIGHNTFRLLDRSLWIDDVDDCTIESNIFHGTYGPNDQHILLATARTCRRIHIKDNDFYDSLRGIRFDGGTLAEFVKIEGNTFESVTTPIDGTVPAVVTILGNHGVADNVVTISRGGAILNPTAAVNLISWRAPVACVVNAVKGYRVGGTGATINARKNGASNHLSSALSLTSADSWMDGGAVSNTAYAAGDKLEIMVVTVAGSPTQVAVQVDFVRS
jgi:hypothetical protein